MKSLKALMVCAALLVGACDGLAPQGNEPTASSSPRQCPAMSGETCDASHLVTATQAIQYGQGPYYCSLATNCPAAEYAECKNSTCVYRACSVGPTAAACPADRPLCDTSVTPASCKGTVVNADSSTPPVLLDGGPARSCMMASECVVAGTTESDWLCRFTAPGCTANDKGACVRNRELVCRNDYQEFCGCDGITMWDYRQASDCAFKQYRSVGACPVVDAGILDGGTVASDGGIAPADGGTSVSPDAGVALDGGVRRCSQSSDCNTPETCLFTAPGCGTNAGTCTLIQTTLQCPSTAANYCGCDGVTFASTSAACVIKPYSAAGVCATDGGTSVLPDAGVVLDGGSSSDLGWSKIEYQPHSLLGVASIELRWWSSIATLLGSVAIDSSIGTKVSFRFRNLATGEKLQLWLKDAAGNILQYGCSFNPATPANPGVWGAMWFYRDGSLVATAPSQDGGAVIIVGGPQGPNCLVP